jgi:hypothetical protein
MLFFPKPFWRVLYPTDLLFDSKQIMCYLKKCFSTSTCFITLFFYSTGEWTRRTVFFGEKVFIIKFLVFGVANFDSGNLSPVLGECFVLEIVKKTNKI